MKKFSLGTKVFIIYFFALTLSLISLASFLDSHLVNFLSFVCFLLYFLYIYREKQFLFFLLLPFSFPHLTAIISNIYLDTGVYISELSLLSEATGAASRLIFFVLTMFTMAYCVFSLLYNNMAGKTCYVKLPVRRFEDKALILFAVIIITALIFGLYKWGSPLSEGEQRFEYWKNHPLPWFKSLLYQTYLLGFLIGCIIIQATNKRILLFVLIVCLGLNVLYGEKFTGLMITALYFICGFIVSYYINYGMPKRLINVKTTLLAIVAFIFVFSLVYYQYKYIHNVGNNVVGYILNRLFSLQGEVWWASDYLYFNDKLSPDSYFLFNEGASCVDYGGLYYLMRNIAPWSLVSAYCDRGVTFTMGFPAIGLATIGYANTILLSIFAGALVGLTSFLTMISIRNRNYIALFFAFKVVLIETHALNMGNMHNIFDYKFMFYLIAFIFISRIAFTYEKINSHVPASIPSGQAE